jgi:uncharacterized protein YjiK
MTVYYGKLYLLSHESKEVVVICTRTGKEIGSTSLKAKKSGLKKGVKQAEGITFDDEGRMLIMSEPNDLHIFGEQQENDHAED